MARASHRRGGLAAPYAGSRGVDGAAITTFGVGAGAEVVDASDVIASGIDELQLDLGVGPGWDAVRTEHVVVAPDLGVETRWPVARDAFLAFGARSLSAFPLAFGGVRIGAVTTYALAPGSLDDDVCASIVERTRTSALLLMAETVREASLEASANPGSRRVIHQATGMVLARFGLTPSDGLAVLQAHAFTVGRPVVQVAADIVEGRSRFLDPDGPTVVDAGGGEHR